MSPSYFAVVITILATLFHSPAIPAFGSQAEKRYDVIVVGGGAGGSAAAIQASRLGASVAVVEETGWIGGQITASAVSTMDDVGFNRSGLYGEFVERIKETYKTTDTPYNLCYWGSDTIASDPKTAEAILLHMMKNASPGKVDIYFHTQASGALMEGQRVVGIRARNSDGSEMILKAPVTVDATECGDFIPMTGARYRAGNSISPNINLDAEIQDITWVAVIRRQSSLTNDLAVQRPQGYDWDVSRFRKIVAKKGCWWPGFYPFNTATFLAYRAMPDRENKVFIDGGEWKTWSAITRSALNWGNDVPANGPDNSGLTARYLEDKNYRRLINGQGVNRTLGLLYYLNDELGLSDWTVDDTQGYDKKGDKVTDRAIVIDGRNDKVIAHFPPMPYVRESRRIVGLYTMTAKDIKRSVKTARALKNNPSSIALGEYPVDIHGSRVFGSLESDLGESTKDLPSQWRRDEGVFQVPYGSLIPERIKGFMAAEKNISVSRMVNGATRLQPIAILTGQAVGAASALAARYNLDPGDIPVILVQDLLLKAGSRLSLSIFRDLEITDPYWRGIEGVTLYGLMDPMSTYMFGPALFLEREKAQVMIRKAFGKQKEAMEAEGVISRQELADIIAENVPNWTEPENLWIGPMTFSVTKKEAAMALWEALVQRNEASLKAKGL